MRPGWNAWYCVKEKEKIQLCQQLINLLDKEDKKVL